MLTCPRLSEPIRLLKTPRSLSVYVQRVDVRHSTNLAPSITSKLFPGSYPGGMKTRLQ